MCGTLHNESGTVHFDGQLDGRAAGQQAHPPRHGAQLPAAAAVPTLSVAENLRIPLLYTAHARSGRHLLADEIEARCHELAGLVGLAAKANKLPRDLTQVEMRKLELARAMAADPKLLIADEAMAGLSQSEVDRYRRPADQDERARRHHHPDRAHHARGDGFSQRLVVLVSGKKIADGAPQEVVSHPEVIGAYLGQ